MNKKSQDEINADVKRMFDKAKRRGKRKFPSDSEAVEHKVDVVYPPPTSSNDAEYVVTVVYEKRPIEIYTLSKIEKLPDGTEKATFTVDTTDAL